MIINKSTVTLAFNIDIVLSYGLLPTFGTFTFKTPQDYAFTIMQWKRFRDRLVKRTDCYGVRIFEYTKKETIHIHVLFNRFIFDTDVDLAKDGLWLGDIYKIIPVWERSGMQGYLIKEFSKQFSQEDVVGRKFDCFGKFPIERERIKDMRWTGDFFECCSEAWSVREKWEKKADVMKVAYLLLRKRIEADFQRRELELTSDDSYSTAIPDFDVFVDGVPF